MLQNNNNSLLCVVEHVSEKRNTVVVFQATTVCRYKCVYWNCSI